MTPYMPTEARSKATPANEPSTSMAKRGSVMESSTIVLSVVIFASGKSGSTERNALRTSSVSEAGSTFVRRMTSMVRSDGQTFWLYGTYISGGGSSRRERRFTSATTPMMVSPGYFLLAGATCLPMASSPGQNFLAIGMLMMVTG